MSNLILKEIIALKNQQEIYLIKDEEGVFLYRRKKVLKYSVVLICRRKCCQKRLKMNPIHNVR